MSQESDNTCPLCGGTGLVEANVAAGKAVEVPAGYLEALGRYRAAAAKQQAEHLRQQYRMLQAQGMAQSPLGYLGSLMAAVPLYTVTVPLEAIPEPVKEPWLVRAWGWIRAFLEQEAR